MGDLADEHEEVMEKVRQRQQHLCGESVGLDEIDPDEAWNEEFKSWEDSDDEDFSSYDEDIEYEVGDIIRLNSGGPLMTIKEVNNKIITCRWFDKSDNLQNEEFNETEIVLANKVENYQNPSTSKNKIPDVDINNDEIAF